MTGGYDLDAPADVYLVRSSHRGAPAIMWRMTVRDAQAVCSDQSTCGIGRGGPWMFCWTAHTLVDLVPKAFIPDDGRFAPLFERLGVTVLASRSMLERTGTR